MDLSKVFFWGGGGEAKKKIGRFVVMPAYPGRVVLRIKYSQTCFSVISLILSGKF